MIELIPTSPNYAEIWHTWRQEPESLRHNPIVIGDLKSLRSRMEAFKSDLSNLKAAEEFQLFVKWNGQFVGSVNLKNISHMMKYGEIGYGISQEFQGKGLGTEAVRAFVKKIFEESEMRRLFAYVAEGNTASRRLLEKVGFTQEGICRDHYIINGQPTNEVLYGILRSDWEKLKSKSTYVLDSDMLSHISFSVSDLHKSTLFYDAVLGSLGYKRVYSGETASGWGSDDDHEQFAIKKRVEKAAAPSKGFHLAFNALKKEDVHFFHDVGLKHGGKDNGKPGPRPEYGSSYYAAFLIDPDGYEVEVKLKV